MSVFSLSYWLILADIVSCEKCGMIGGKDRGIALNDRQNLCMSFKLPVQELTNFELDNA